MCDGLPVIPPTRALVQEMLRFCDRPADEVLIPHCFPSGLPLNDHGDSDQVTVIKCESPHNVVDPGHGTPEGLLQRLADMAVPLGGHPADGPAELMLLLNPEHARRLHSAGWSKTDVHLSLAAMAHSMVGMPWGDSRAVTKAVRLRNGEPARQIEAFQDRQDNP